MAYFNKIALLILNDDQTKFMVCVKNHFTSDFILPGGQIEAGENDIQCLIREVKEELSVATDQSSLKYIGEYHDIAAGDPTKDVMIRLYRGNIIGDPRPSQEIIEFHWLGKDDLSNPRISPIIKNKILPDLIEKNILL